MCSRSLRRGTPLIRFTRSPVRQITVTPGLGNGLNYRTKRANETGRCASPRCDIRSGRRRAVAAFPAGFSNLHDEILLILAEDDLVAAHPTLGGNARR